MYSNHALACSSYSLLFYVQFGGGGGGRGGGRDDFEAPSNYTSSFVPNASSGSGLGVSKAAAVNDDDMWD